MLKKYLIASIVGLSIAGTAYAGVFDFLKPLLFDNQEQSFGDTGTITRIDQWSATTSPITAVTPRVFGKPVFLSGHIQLAETTTPATPALNHGVLYVADDQSGGDGISALFFLDDAGTVTQLGSGGGGGGGCTNLNCLTDVVLTSIASSSVLTYNGSEWIDYLPNFNSIFGVASTTQGGTNITSYTTGDMIYASATNVLSKLGIGSSGQVLVSNGTGPVWSSDVPTLSGVSNFTGTVSFTNFPTVAGTATTSAQLVNLQTVSNLIQGVGLLKEAVRAATTANGALATAFDDGSVIDGVTLATGDRILIKDQTDASENGIYDVQAAGAPVRATDYDATDEADRGTSVSVLLGTAHAGSLWVQTTDDPVIDTSDLVFQQLPPPTTYTASQGVQLVGTDFRLNLGTNSGLSLFGLNTLWVDHDNNTLSTSTGKLAVNDGGITGTQLATGAVVLSSGDVTGTLPIANGGTNNTTAGDDAVLVGNGTTFELKTLPTCTDVNGQHLNYSTASNSWVCGTSGSGAGGSGTGGELIYSKSLDVSTSTVEVANTTAVTEIYSIEIPAGVLNLGGVVRYIVTGTYKNNAGSARQLSYSVQYGGSTINSDTSANFTSSAITGQFAIEGYLTGGTTTSSVFSSAELRAENLAGGTQSIVDVGSLIDGAVDSGTAQTLSVRVNHSAPANANTVLIKQFGQTSHINATTSLAAEASLTPWTENIDGAGYDLLDVGDIEAVTFSATGTTASVFPYASSTSLSTGRLFVTDTIGTTSISNVLTVSGKTGIGTTTPTTRLTLADGTSAFSIDPLSEGTSIQNNALNGIVQLKIGRLNAGPFMQTYQSLPLIIQPSGNNTGIGTTSPANILSVTGDTYITGDLGLGIANPTAGKVELLQTTDSSSGGITLRDSTSANTLRLWTDSTTGYIYDGSTGAGNLVFNGATGKNAVGTSTISSNILAIGGTQGTSGGENGTGEIVSIDGLVNFNSSADVGSALKIRPTVANIGTLNTLFGISVDLKSVTNTSQISRYVGMHVAEETTNTFGTSTIGYLFGNTFSSTEDYAFYSNSTDKNYFGGDTGIASTSPWGLLSVNANALTSNKPQFVVGSSTATNLIVSTGGNVGVGTTTPGTLLSVGGDTYVVGGLGIGAVNTTDGDLVVAGNDINVSQSASDSSIPTNISYGASTATGGTAGSIFKAAGGGNGTGAGSSKEGGDAAASHLSVGGSGAGASGADTNNGGIGGDVFLANGGEGGEESDGGAAGDIIAVAGGVAGQSGGSYGADGTFTIGRDGGSENALLKVNGTINLQQAPAQGAGDTTLCLDSTGEIQTGATCTASTKKVKENIKALSGSESLKKILALQSVTFNYDKNYYNGRSDMGFIAEQAYEIDHRFANLAEQDETLLNGKVIKKGDPVSLNTNAILSASVAAVQELSTKGVTVTTEAKRSMEENWQWLVIALLAFGLGVQQYQIRKLKVNR